MRRDIAASEAFEIGPARPEELEALPDLERRAASIFPEGTLPEGTREDALAPAMTREAQAEGRLFVAREMASGRVAGFALVGEADGHAHLEEIDVDPDWGRRGLGRRLVEYACEWAIDQGYGKISLSTFREIPWNAPFYARLGFDEVDPSPFEKDIRRRREHEEQAGFDLSTRCLMVRVLSSD